MSVDGVPIPSSTPEISPVPNSTQNKENQNTTTTTTNDPSSNSKCLPLPFGGCCSTSPPPPTTTSVPAPAPAPAPDNPRKHALDILNLIATELKHVEKASKDLVDYGNGVTVQIKDASEAMGSLNKLVKGESESENQSQSPPEDLDDADLQELLDLKKKVLKLKLQIPSKYKPETTQTDVVSDSDLNRNQQQRSVESQHGNRIKASKKQGKLPNLSKGSKFEQSLSFKDINELYDTLDNKQKLCLLSFSVFPENEVIKKRFMLYWWIGEGFVGTPEKKAEQVAGERTNQRESTEEQLPFESTAEYSANEIFNELLKKGFIEPFSEKRTLKVLVSKCKMHPFVRAAVVILAKRAKFFDFDSEGKLTNSFSSSYRACLLADKNPYGKEDLNNLHMLFNVDQTSREFQNLEFQKLFVENLNNLHMLFNVDQTILEFQKPERFSMLKNINIFCLGRWQSSPRHHIEVEDTNFLEGFKNMKHLKFLSLQGISRIMELPTSISKLVNLTILDLKACPNLEIIPKEIGLLKCLTHLDMSECYLLDTMPKEISTLAELQVLKGFVVETLNLKGKNTCTLEQLANLRKLRKLSVYTGRKDFPAETELKDLYKFKALRKLTIEWGGGSQGKLANDSSREKVAEKPMEAEAKQPEIEGEGQSTGEKSIPTEITQPENAREGKSMPAEATQPGNEGEGKSIDTEGIVPENGTEGKSTTEVSKKENHEDANTKNQVNAEDSTATPATTNRCNYFKLATKKVKRTMTRRNDKEALAYTPAELPTQLEKLDLQCYPETCAPDWLKAKKLENVKKLYIRGGMLRNVGQFDYEERCAWKVEILRLKFLRELEMDWRETRELFPKMIYLEKVRCPKLTLFPCDEDGVWIKKT